MHSPRLYCPYNLGLCIWHGGDLDCTSTRSVNQQSVCEMKAKKKPVRRMQKALRLLHRLRAFSELVEVVHNPPLSRKKSHGNRGQERHGTAFGKDRLLGFRARNTAIFLLLKQQEPLYKKYCRVHVAIMVIRGQGSPSIFTTFSLPVLASIGWLFYG